MTKKQAWISAARLRTLPLSISGIMAAGAAAFWQDVFSWSIFVLSLLTTLGFQILSNFANDYGDGIKGTDNLDRIGPTRAMQSGALSAKELKKGMRFMVIITTIACVALIYTAFGSTNLGLSLLFLALGFTAIAAAIKYTVGENAYGYHALGDVFVFVFFGLVSVLGGYFLYSKSLDWMVALPAITMGLWSVAVLHLNNMRDRQSDIKSNKITLAIKLGPKISKVYHWALIDIGAVMAILFAIFTWESWVDGVPFIAFIPLGIHLVKVFKTTDQSLLDPELKKVALSTFLYALLLLITKAL